MIEHSATKKAGHSRTPDGQERLATQSERNDIKKVLDNKTMTQIRAKSAVVVDRRECGDEVNRFLLCTLVNHASRYIKARAERSGETIPMTTVVRGTLRSFRLAALEHDGPLNGSSLDLPALTALNSGVLRSEIERYRRARVKRDEVLAASRQKFEGER